MSRIAKKSWCNNLANEAMFNGSTDLNQCPTRKQINETTKLMVKDTGTTWDSLSTLVNYYTDNRLVKQNDIGHKVQCSYYNDLPGLPHIYFCQNGFDETSIDVPQSAKTLYISPFSGTNTEIQSKYVGFSNEFFSNIGGSAWANSKISADLSSSTPTVAQYVINQIPGTKSTSGNYFYWDETQTGQIYNFLKTQHRLDIYISKNTTSYTLVPSIPAGEIRIANGMAQLVKLTYQTYETDANGNTILANSKVVTPAWTTDNSELVSFVNDSIVATSNDKQGVVKVTATYAGITITWNVQVYKNTYSLTIEPTSTSMIEGDSTSFKAIYNKHYVTTTGTSGTIESQTNMTSSCDWESSDSTVATVSKGVVIGKSAGTTTITAKYPASSPTHTVTATVTVKSRGKVSFLATNYSTNFLNRGFSKSQYEEGPYIGTFELWAASMCNTTGYSYSYQKSGSVDILFEITKSGEWQSGYYYMLQATNTATYLSEVYISSEDVIKLNNGTNVTLTPRELTLAHATDPANYLVLTITNFKNLSDIAYSSVHMDVADGVDKNWILTTSGYPITEYISFDYMSHLYNYINTCTNTISATKESWQNLKSWINGGGRVFLAPIDPDSGETEGYDGWSKEADAAVLTAIETLAGGSNATCEWPTLTENTESLFAVYTTSDYEAGELNITCYARIYNTVTNEYKYLSEGTSIQSSDPQEETYPLGRIDDLTVEYIRQCELQFYGDWYSGYGIAEVYLITNDANSTRRAIYQTLDLNGDSWMDRPNSPSIIADLSTYQAGDTVELWLNGDGAGPGGSGGQITYVEGYVKDSIEPLIMASVVVQGTTYGCSTDLNGYYIIHAPTSVLQNGTLEVSYIGYKTKTVAINGRSRIDFVLEEDLGPEITNVALNIIPTQTYLGWIGSSYNTVQLIPRDASTNQTVPFTSRTWTSSNTSAATVDTNGKVTPNTSNTAATTDLKVNFRGEMNPAPDVVIIGEGSADIRVAKGGIYYANIGDSHTIEKGSTKQLTATIQVSLQTGQVNNIPSSSVTHYSSSWTSSNTSVATVDSSGKVTAKAAGTTIITYKTKCNYGGDLTATSTITVTADDPKIQSLWASDFYDNSYSGQTLQGRVGEWIELRVGAETDTGINLTPNVTISTGNSSVATHGIVNKNTGTYYILCQGTGSTTIYCSYSGTYGSKTITVPVNVIDRDGVNWGAALKITGSTNSNINPTLGIDAYIMDQTTTNVDYGGNLLIYNWYGYEKCYAFNINPQAGAIFAPVTSYQSLNNEIIDGLDYNKYQATRIGLKIANLTGTSIDSMTILDPYQRTIWTGSLQAGDLIFLYFDPVGFMTHDQCQRNGYVIPLTIKTTKNNI